ncbi:MAG: DUF2807 domain-containing protein [Cyclobacteriaceae bacterium]
MKKTSLALSLLISLVFAYSGLAQQRTVDLNNSFDELAFGVSGTLYLKQGSEQKVEVECSDDIFAKLEIEVKGSKLEIKLKDKWGWNSGIKKSNLTIYVTMTEINWLSLSGSGSLIGENQIEVKNLGVSLSGSGNVNLFALGEKLTLKISGSGKISLDGKANSIDAKISGSGSIKAKDLEVASVDAAISGSGSVYITVTDEIRSRISGSGSVYYAGNPKKLDNHSSGSGKIRKL